jgi:hypothetical protein
MNKSDHAEMRHVTRPRLGVSDRGPASVGVRQRAPAAGSAAGDHAIRWKLRTGAPWRDVPEGCGPATATHERQGRPTRIVPDGIELADGTVRLNILLTYRWLDGVPARTSPGRANSVY